MKKISIKNIVDFRNKSDRGKLNFANSLRLDNIVNDADGGGNYWISSLSAISNSFKSNNLQSIKDKIGELEEKYGEAEFERTRTMYRRNIDILYNYENFNLRKWKPGNKLQFEKKNKSNSILAMKGFQIQVTPHHVFTYKKDNSYEIGAIWFVAKLNGLKKEELGMFTEILYKYLKIHFSKKYEINFKYCIAVDVFNNFDISYSELHKNEIPSILSSTLEEIKKLM